MSKKRIKVCRTLNYIEQILILASAITGFIWISAFSSFIGSSAVGLNIYEIAAGIKKFRSISKKKKNKHDKIILFAKYKLNSIEVLISRALIETKINQDKFVLINNVLKEHEETKQEKFKHLIRPLDLAM